jgi:ribosomal protein S20
MLSALVQSQAAIVAIVITLTLIAVQLTASAYSPRVIDIFKKNPDMWLLLGCYGVSIFYGFFVLKLVKETEGGAVSQSAIWSLGPISISFEFFVSLAYWLGAFTFVALFPYMWNIISLLKSENIIKRLTIEINRDKILNSKEDPIQPIADIIHGSIMKYDLETTRVGLNAVTDQVIEIIDSDTEREISKLFCEHLVRSGRLAIRREDEGSTVEVIKNLENFGKSAADRSLESATVQAIEFLGAVGIAAVKIGLEFSPLLAAMSLGVVGRHAVENRLEDATSQVASSIYSVGEKATEKGLEDATSEAARSLRDVGIDAAGNRLKNATLQAVRCLGFVGKASAEKGFKDATLQTGVFLEGVGRAAVEKELDDAIRRAALCLGIVGKAAAEKELDDATKQAALSLAKLTLLSEEIVKTAIRDYESELKEQDRDSFQKFMKEYEQELEKLQAEK